jgi:hypothetical protein
MRLRSGRAVLRSTVSLAAGTVALALAIGASVASADETQARELVLAMTKFLAAQPSLSFDVDSNFEIVTTDGQKLSIASSGSVMMQRPDKIHVLRRSGFAEVEMTFDGKMLSVLNRTDSIGAQIELPGSIEQLIDTLRDDYRRPLPAADLLVADPGSVLLAEVTGGMDLGSGVIRGQECDHLAFRGPEVDWQIWIAQGAKPYPCRFVITTKTVAGEPQYTLDFSAWGAGAASAEFTIADLDGAKMAELAGVPYLDELDGIYKREGSQ